MRYTRLWFHAWSRRRMSLKYLPSLFQEAFRQFLQYGDDFVICRPVRSIRIYRRLTCTAGLSALPQTLIAQFSAVLVFQLLEPLDVGSFHAAVLRFPPVVRRVTDRMLPANIFDLPTSFYLLQYPDNLGSLNPPFFIKVFAGQRDETFYIDLGATFDTLNFRTTPILSAAQDGNDGANPFGVDLFSGFNVNTIAIQVPIAQITDNPNTVISMYASASRKRLGKFGFKQVARMANPLVNELLIGTGEKDRWNAQDPKDEQQFVDFYLNPRLVAVLNLAFGTNFPSANRTDLVNALLKYPGQPQTGTCSKASPCSELLRVDLSQDPTPPANQKRLGVLAGDVAGFPNGRRPNDDVTDIALRVVAGALLGDTTRLGDGVNFNIGAQGSNLTANGIYTVFPYLPTPHDGRDRQHLDPGE